jgi:hypothetical protein
LATDFTQWSILTPTALKCANHISLHCFVARGIPAAAAMCALACLWSAYSKVTSRWNDDSAYVVS